MKAEDRAAAGIGFEEIGEAGLDAGGLIAERQRSARGGEVRRKPLAISIGLDLDLGQRDTGFLRFYYAGCVAINVKEIVGKAVTRSEKEFTNVYRSARPKINAISILDDPSGIREQAVDIARGAILRAAAGWHGHD
jgi:hypothetical protein